MTHLWAKICIRLQVAAVSGDARRALEICRRAAEVADYRAKKSQLSSSGEKIIYIYFCFILFSSLNTYLYG